MRRRFVGNDAYARASSLYFTAKTASFASFEIVSQSPLALSALLYAKAKFLRSESDAPIAFRAQPLTIILHVYYHRGHGLLQSHVLAR